MGSMWYPGAWDAQGRATEPWAEVAVPDPEHGRLLCQRLDGRFEGLGMSLSDEVGEFAGERMADLLDKVTKLALGLDSTPHVVVRASRGRAMVVGRDEAAELLPILQRAVVLAVGGHDRFEHVWPDSDAIAPAPLCANCNEGSSFSSRVTISPWCSEHGHSPFGVAGSTSWEGAHRSYAVGRDDSGSVERA